MERKTAFLINAAKYGMNTFYELLIQQLQALLADEKQPVTIYANAAALLFQELPAINWAGFYLYDAKNDELYLGPFQGKPACMHIPMNAGVCGTCAHTRMIQRIGNVHQFAGHIACDSASNAEIVLPLIKEDTLLGVLDIDSTHFERFTAEDEQGLQAFCQQLLLLL